MAEVARSGLKLKPNYSDDKNHNRLNGRGCPFGFETLYPTTVALLLAHLPLRRFGDLKQASG